MGFDANFITGFPVSLPELGEQTKQSSFNNGAPLEHTRFSIIFNKDRGLATCTAHNIDGGSLLSAGSIARNDNFRADPLVPSDLQVDNNRGYRRNPWDRGHLVRRRSLHWGDVGEAEQADSESFYWTNIAPQHTRLHSTAWGNIEDWMLNFTDAGNKKVSVLTGPVMTPNDPVHQNAPGEDSIRIPAGFWKILAVQNEGRNKAAAFLVWQRDFDRDNPVEFDPVLEQVRITTIEFLVGLSFGDLREADPLRFGSRSTPPGITAEDRDRLRERRESSPTAFAAPQPEEFAAPPEPTPVMQRSAIVTGPTDIVL